MVCISTSARYLPYLYQWHQSVNFSKKEGILSFLRDSWRYQSGHRLYHAGGYLMLEFIAV